MNAKKSLLGSLVVFSLLFCAFIPFCSTSAVAETAQWEKPVWKGGEEWALGAKYDLKDIMGEAFDQLEKQGYDVSFDGKLAYYWLTTVEGKETVRDVECYKLYFKGAFGVRVDLKMKMSQSAEGMSMSMDVDAHGIAIVKIDGNLYLTVEKLAFVKLEFKISVDVDIDAKMDMSMSGGGQSVDMHMTMLARIPDLLIEYNLESTPPLEVFDWPIYVDKTWRTNEVNMAVSGSVKGSIKVSVKTKGNMPTGGAGGTGGMEDINVDQTFDEKMSGTFLVPPIPLKCIGTQEITLLNDEKVTAFIIVIDQDEIADDMNNCGKVVSDTTKIKLPGQSGPTHPVIINPLQGMPGLTPGFTGPTVEKHNLYFDSKSGGVVQQDTVGTGDKTLVSAKPKSKEEVNDFYANPKATIGEKGGGGGFPILYVIILVVVVVVIVVVAVVLVRKKKKAAAVPPSVAPGPVPPYQPSAYPPPTYPPPAGGPPTYYQPPQQPQPPPYGP